MDRVPLADGLLRQLYEVLASPLGSIGHGLSELLAPFVTHSALILFTADVSGGRLHWWGDPVIHQGMSGLALDRLRSTSGGVEGIHRAALRIGDAQRPVLQMVARNGALLLMVDPGPVSSPTSVTNLWNIVSLHVQERADEAAPAYLRHARSTAGVRLLALSEISDEYSATLDGILAPLRAGRLSDASAREAALNRSVAGLDRLRAMSGQARTLAQETVSASFARLEEELRSAVRHWHGQLEFIGPSRGDHPVPDEVARGARAVIQRVVLCRLENSEVSRIRVQWECDGNQLLVDLRDDGAAGAADAEALLEIARQRIEALGGQLSSSATSGWGAEFSVILPLDPPPVRPSTAAIAGLRPRERQVANLLAAGSRNRVIAEELGISENTVKFHVSRILRTLNAGSRAEAIAALLSEQRT